MPTATSDVSASIAVTGDPTYIMAVLFTDVDEITTVPNLWTNLFPQAVAMTPPYKVLVAYRIVNQKGAYTFKTTLPASTNWAIVLLAFKGAQPISVSESSWKHSRRRDAGANAYPVPSEWTVRLARYELAEACR